MEHDCIAISTFGHHNMGHRNPDEASQYILFKDHESMLRFCELANQITIPGSRLIFGVHPIWDTGLGDLWDEPHEWRPIALGSSCSDFYIAKYPINVQQTQLYEDGTVKEIVVDQAPTNKNDDHELHVLTSLEQYLCYLRKIKMGRGTFGSARKWEEQKIQLIRICEEFLGLPLTPFPEDPYMEGQKLLKRLFGDSSFNESGLGTLFRSNSKFYPVKYRPADPQNLCEFLMALEVRGIEAVYHGPQLSRNWEEDASKLNFPIHFIIDEETDNIMYWEKGESWHKPGKVL